jgi:hypothetical protein
MLMSGTGRPSRSEIRDAVRRCWECLCTVLRGSKSAETGGRVESMRRTVAVTKTERMKLGAQVVDAVETARLARARERMHGEGWPIDVQ